MYKIFFLEAYEAKCYTPLYACYSTAEFPQENHSDFI